MDPSKFARAENASIVRDAVHITLTDGTIQLTNSVNGVVFGAVFHGNGRLEAVPPNPLEAHQLLLFTKQDTLNMAFTDATFSFSDAFAEVVSYAWNRAARSNAARKNRSPLRQRP
jgi:hypothetical protein